MKTSPLGRTVTRDLGTRISCHTRTRAGRMAPHPALLPRREGDLQPAPGAQLSHPFRVSGGVQPCTAWTAWRQRSWGCCRARAPLWPQCFELAGGGGGGGARRPPAARAGPPAAGRPPPPPRRSGTPPLLGSGTPCSAYARTLRPRTLISFRPQQQSPIPSHGAQLLTWNMLADGLAQHGDFVNVGAATRAQNVGSSSACRSADCCVHAVRINP